MTPAKPLTICIIGLLPVQQNAVRAYAAGIPGAPDLRFYDSGSGSHTFPQHIDWILCNKFARHAIWHRARKLVASNRLVFLTGGVTQILQKLSSITHFVPAAKNIQPTKENNMRSRKQYPEEFKRLAVERAQRETVPIVADELGIAHSMLYNWRNKYATDGTPTTNGASRTFWTNEETAKVAVEWVLLRVSDPFESATTLAEQAQRKALPGDRQREIQSLKNLKPLVHAIEAEWKAFMDRPSAPAELPPAPEPQVITVEVPRKLTAAEMLETLDEPALEALLAAKRLVRESQFHELLSAIAAKAGAENLPKISGFSPRLELFDAGVKSNPRIAVIGIPAEQQPALVEQVKAANLTAKLRFPNGKDKETVGHCDFAIVCRDASKAGSSPEGDRAVGQLGRSRVVLMDSHDTLAVTQQIRNLLSRQ